MSEIKPYRQEGSKHEQVKAMFDNIASTYDCLNHTLSLGIDRLWRKMAVRQIRRLHPSPIRSILDVATGTGDLAILACRQLTPDEVVGCDISDEMMRVGEQKVQKLGLVQSIRFVHEDCSKLSFPNQRFDVVMSAFALRNFENLHDCLTEMRRVLAPEGCIVVIDLCAPRRFPMKQVFWLYQHAIMPLLGSRLSHDQKAYTYLPATMKAVMQGDEMDAEFRAAGFSEMRHRYLAFGMCCIYMGRP